MSGWKSKRFWKEVEVTEGEGGYSVTLDGRPVRSPAKTLLVLPTRALAEAVAQGWQAQEDELNPLSMPFTRSANAALDKVTTQHAEVADMLADYGDSDLLCYRADHPAELVTRQAEAWDPLLDWAAEAFGARLEPRTGIIHAPQPPQALEPLRRRVHAADAFELTALHDLVSISGSLVIGLAAASDFLSPGELWLRSRVDETWQEEQWGMDEEAREEAELKRSAFLHAHKLHMLTRNVA